MIVTVPFATAWDILSSLYQLSFHIFSFKCSHMLNNHDKYSQVLEDKTLSGTPQCPPPPPPPPPPLPISLLKKSFFYNIYTHVQYVFIYILYMGIYIVKKTFFFSNEAVGGALGVPDRILSSSTCANITIFFHEG